MRTEIINTFEQLRLVSSKWNTLFKNSGSNSFFLTWEWVFSWAECFLGNKRTLFILTLYEKEHLIGIAPFYLERIKVGPFSLNELRFLGTPESGSDYLDVISQNGREKKVAEALYAYLTGDIKSKWDQLALTDIRAESLFLLHFMNCIEVAGRYAELKCSAYCPFMHLPGAIDEFYAMMSSGWRKKFKQDLRVSKRDYIVSHQVIQGREVPDRLGEFFQLYEEKGGWSGQKLHTVLKRLSEKYNDAPPIQLDFLLIDDQAMAALLHFKYQGTLSMYLMAVDKEFNPKISFGNILVGRSIINAIESEFTVYDFLKGSERYKFHWATGGYSTVQIRFWQKSPGTLFSAFGRMLRNEAKLLLR